MGGKSEGIAGRIGGGGGGSGDSSNSSDSEDKRAPESAQDTSGYKWPKKAYLGELHNTFLRNKVGVTDTPKPDP